MRYPTALSIAGSDSSGGAGIQADLKTFSALGVYGASVLTSITAQNTKKVRAVETLSPDIILKQLEAVFDDIKIDAVKTGMLVTPEIMEIIAHTLDKYKPRYILIDPVMVATTGDSLTKANITDAYRQLLYSRLTLLTPNIPEAEQLSGISIQNEYDRQKAAEILLNQGCKAVLIKGGHLSGEESTDILFMQESAPVSFSSTFIHTTNMHGTGCTLASAIAAYLALGNDLKASIQKAKKYVANAIVAGADIDFEGGNGPINHFFSPQILNAIKQ